MLKKAMGIACACKLLGGTVEFLESMLVDWLLDSSDVLLTDSSSL